MEILFCRFGSFAMTVVKNRRYSSMLWLRNAWTANLITRAKHGAEQVAMARPLQWNWQWQWQLQVYSNRMHLLQGFPLTVSITWVIFMDRGNCGHPLVVLTLLSAGNLSQSILSCSFSTRRSLMIHMQSPVILCICPPHPPSPPPHIVLLYLKNAIYAFIAIYFLVSLHWYGADCSPK